MERKGIDVSQYRGKIDWELVKYQGNPVCYAMLQELVVERITSCIKTEWGRFQWYPHWHLPLWSGGKRG